jgi:hypothetical protein
MSVFPVNLTTGHSEHAAEKKREILRDNEKVSIPLNPLPLNLKLYNKRVAPSVQKSHSPGTRFFFQNQWKTTHREHSTPLNQITDAGYQDCSVSLSYPYSGVKQQMTIPPHSSPDSTSPVRGRY